MKVYNTSYIYLDALVGVSVFLSIACTSKLNSTLPCHRLTAIPALARPTPYLLNSSWSIDNHARRFHKS